MQPYRQRAINNFVFYFSASIILIGALLTSLWPDQSAHFLNQAQAFVANYLSWYYMMILCLCFIFVSYIALSPYGKIKLGKKDEQPEFSYMAWVAMLFSAGIGIALIYFGAYEPIEHFLNPPAEKSGTASAAQNAMVLSFFHWGIHGWALYALIAVILSYYTYNKGLPLSLRSAFFPFFMKEKKERFIGNLVDAFAILTTVIAMVTNLGIGALILQAGLGKSFAFPQGIYGLIGLIIFMTIIASIIATFSIEKGFALLSKINIILLCILLFFVFIASAPFHILDAIVQNIGDYLNNFVKLSFNLYIYENATEWRGLWTIFYWAWWITWAPFVGLFIARISKGRTIRELVFGVMFIPLGFTLLWLSVFGNAALDLVFVQGFQKLGQTIINDPQNALFHFLEYLPFRSITIILATFVSFVLFFAPVESGTLMVANLSMQEKETDAPKWMRAFWCIDTAFITIGLFISNNFMAIQTSVVLCGIPFSIIFLFYMAGFLKTLKRDHHENSNLS